MFVDLCLWFDLVVVFTRGKYEAVVWRPAARCCVMFQSSLCHWELFKFLLCKYWHTQWAGATFCLSLSSSEAQYNNSLCWIYFFCIIILNAPLSQLGGLKLPRTSRAGTDCSPDTAQKFDKVTFCTFSTSSQECICCLIWGSILTLLNVLASGSGIVC